MIHLYPANKMENLLLLLNKISQLSPLGVFNQEVIVVQNAGMQHWLNLAIAQERGISMNMRYALPAQFLWKLIRSLASDEKVPEQSPYSREVLCWRIHALLALDSVVEDDDFSQATHYWRGENTTDEEDNNTVNDSKHAQLKRYQLATQLADLYEQYLIFRPQWLDNWQQGNFELDGLEKISASEHKWQGKLWRLLIAQLPYNPVELMHDAIANIQDKKELIPPRISFFGLNTMAPMWLNFINALSEHVEVHFFHLNPCFSYWGDVVTEKYALNKLSQWSDGVLPEELDVHSYVGNPLLANLGQQGREFISMLQDYSTIDVELFEQAKSAQAISNNNDVTSVLHQLQNDILELSDARSPDDEAITPKAVQHDDSIVITSCHSALREVQALHDYLLHQFNQDKSLTPKDILVMCPQIEQYAPYVNAVFTRGWQDIAGEVPPLPCSIADRSAKDSDPLVAAFTELLTLPDSRFGVSQLLSFLRLPAMANNFSINGEDLAKISAWLEQATVHWGLDLTHKQSLLGQQANASFTWQQGLSRLLRGFAYADSEQIYQQQLLLSNVEGSDSILLGQLMLFIEQLHYFSENLQRSRTAIQWQTFLLEQLSHLFSRVDADNVSNENSLMVIEQAIAGLVEHCHHAHFEDDISLLIVVDYLSQHFSQGDASKQFMVGQVTFCSMLPMRSIPFKVIAVLGLNDGEFPRQRQALGFDLMSLSKAKLGDRSRRGDDRYLFLEAIISSRNSLYLSYQGRNIKNNNEKQPSLVVKELMEYLAQGYGWQFSEEQLTSDNNNDDTNAESNQSGIYQLAMQAFSPNNYRGTWPSFDANWLALGQSSNSDNDESMGEGSTLAIESLAVTPEQTVEVSLSCQQLIRFYQHPAKMFAQQQLNLYFENHDVLLEDVEPFSVNHLQSYLLRQDLLSAALTGTIESPSNKDGSEQVITRAHLSGKFPDLPTTTNLFKDYQLDVQQFSEEISKVNCENPELIDCNLVLDIDGTEVDGPSAQKIRVSLNTKLAVKNNLLVHYRSSSAKAKDKFVMYFQQLVVQVWQDQAIANETNITDDNQRLQQVTETIGLYFNTKAQKVEQFNVANIADAKSKLINLVKMFFKGQQQVLLLNGELADQVFTKKRGQLVEMTQARFEGLWIGDMSTRGLSDDDYLSYFWPECPQYHNHQADIEFIYQDLYQVVAKQAAKKASKTTAKPSKEAK
ncbi:exodeoxyribonuclease V subunit gamma [Colwellia psychrerythraea]|uniref:RecBCD enzyme subunit RecC n=1 Tax=Colwellia psychrerythraea (strain 34H / ATCC BAA-681) TaxID=167879 RepID=Q480N8_COLP3|nr:exodeoxyribonuclease V subunit gamma [Colwellia psychrerythraea]AAZ25469.1 exodeoxyribonuclease V, gamma subunit [Colwellia psychrerythraea 34H]